MECTLPTLSDVIDVPYQTLNGWVKEGLLRPVKAVSGRSKWKKYDLKEAIIAMSIKYLKAKGASRDVLLQLSSVLRKMKIPVEHLHDHLPTDILMVIPFQGSLPPKKVESLSDIPVLLRKAGGGAFLLNITVLINDLIRAMRTIAPFAEKT